MKDGKCPHCNKDGCYEHCYDAKDGKHEVEVSKNFVTEAHSLCSDNSFVIDVNCKHCGGSGSTTILVEDIDWG